MFFSSAFLIRVCFNQNLNEKRMETRQSGKDGCGCWAVSIKTSMKRGWKPIGARLIVHYPYFYWCFNQNLNEKR
jgi:hypothetical protein